MAASASTNPVPVGAGESFRTLFERFPDALLIHDLDRLLFVNAAYGTLTGEVSSSLAGRPFAELQPEALRAHLRGLLAKAKGEGVPLRGELEITRADGGRLLVESETIPLTFEGRDAFVTYLRDWTACRELQARLQLTDRMATMGTLAGGVAHEINNPLAFVITNLAFVSRGLEWLAGQAPPDVAGTEHLKELRGALADAQEGARRVGEVVRDLRTFARGDTARREPVDLRRIVGSCLQLARSELRKRARLVRDLGDVPEIEANGAQLGQVFLNLLVNAAQAIPPGSQDRNEIRVRVARDSGGGALVSIQDTGSGIPPEVLPRIFDPFFTTRPIGVATGLGLSVCHSVVTGLGGSITVETEVGRGSTFTVHLPASTSSAAKPAPPAAPSEPAARGRILIVDDEPAIGRALKRTLAPSHEVQVLADAREALSLIRGGARFDAILCDLMMPDMTGPELYEALASAAEDQASRMIFLTGGAFTREARAFLDRVPNPTLEKPFETALVRRAIQDLMSRR